MSFVFVDGASYTGATEFLEKASTGLHETLLAIGWSLLDEISGVSGTTDRVYYSTGEDGTEKIYIRIIQGAGAATRISVWAYTYWDAVGHAGYNQIGSDLAISFDITAGDAHTVLGWISGNKNAVAFVIYDKRAGDAAEYEHFSFGNATRVVPAHWGGRTTLTANVTLNAWPTPTDISVASTDNIEVGQRLYLSNQSAGANAGGFRRVIVNGKAAGTLTVTEEWGAVKAFDSGALIGFDPQPTFLNSVNANRPGGSGIKRTHFSRGARFLYSTGSTNEDGGDHGWQDARWCFISSPSFASGSQFTNNINLANPCLYKFNPQEGGHHMSFPTLFAGHVVYNDNNPAAYALRGYTDLIVWPAYEGGGYTATDVLKDGDNTWVVFPDVSASDSGLTEHYWVALKRDSSGTGAATVHATNYVPYGGSSAAPVPVYTIMARGKQPAAAGYLYWLCIDATTIAADYPHGGTCPYGNLVEVVVAQQPL